MTEKWQEAGPSLLVSYFYLGNFEKNRSGYYFRDWVMDSGAYSASTSNVKIDLNRYIDKCRELLSTDDKLIEVFGLDVIGDWRTSAANCERMWEAGIEAIPTFHIGEPWDALISMARDYPKIAVGGCVGKPISVKNQWVAQCFARVWPKKIHGFGFGSASSILRFPFHSVDSTNWEIGPCQFGQWNSMGKMTVRGNRQNLKGEIFYYLELERQARSRWRREMARINGVDGPAIRLADAGARGRYSFAAGGGKACF